MNLNETLETARIKHELDDYEYIKTVRTARIEHEKRAAVCKDLLKNKTMLASKKEYLLWLSGFIEHGGAITHVYDYPMPLDNWLVIQSDFKISPLYGSQSINLIVKDGVKFNGGDQGHSNIYFMDDFSNVGGFVPIYSDTKF